MRCKHDWKIVDKTEVLSPSAERLQEKELILSIEKAREFIALYQRVVSIIMTCRKCGKIDKTVLRC